MRAFTLTAAALLSFASFAAASNTTPVDLGPRAVVVRSAETTEASSDISKRTIGLCIGSFCIGGSGSSSYQSDVNNCGSKNNKCSRKNFPNSSGYQCIKGDCYPKSCDRNYDWDSEDGYCRKVDDDSDNCGTCRNKCNLEGAKSQYCSGGTCIAKSCNSGYDLIGGACVTSVDTTCDLKNCGSRNKSCPGSYDNSLGSVVCKDSVCQPSGGCKANYAFNSVAQKCQKVDDDENNCGAIGAVCSFPRGKGSCQNGDCKLESCNSGSQEVNGVCTAIDTTCDAKNCGKLGNACSFENGKGTCSNSQCSLTSCNDSYALTTKYTYWLVFVTGSYQVCEWVDTDNDSDNCGSVGKKCGSYSSSKGCGCKKGKCVADCNDGYAWDSDLQYCRAVTSDTQNCGAVGNVCPAPNGTPDCKNGKCSIKSCDTKNGYYLVGTTCTNLNLNNDVQNCGGVGTKCPSYYSNGSGVTCDSGVCRATSCNNGFDWDADDKKCRDVGSDDQNCGKCKNRCNFPNGKGSCSGGSCKVSECNKGFEIVDNACVSMDCTSDVKNCGKPGNACKFTNGTGRCSKSVCTYTDCDANYALVDNSCSQLNTDTDVNNCGSKGNKCGPYANSISSPVCINGDCSTTCADGFSFDFDYNYCRDTSSDIAHCGACKNNCLKQLQGSTAASCFKSVCYATKCDKSYTLTDGKCYLIDTNTDINNCGKIGSPCTFSPSGAGGKCDKGKCVLTSCPQPAYVLKDGACIKSTASQKARAKKSKITAPKSLCPGTETACPVFGSSSFSMALNHHFSDLGQFSTGLMEGAAGGYECLDTTQALESCGGCASTGEGQDCTKIRGAQGYACEASVCRVFSCQAGWRPNLAGTRCLRIHNADGAKNGTDARARHVHARSHSHGKVH